MKHNKTKKSLLAVGTSVLAPAMVMLVEGNMIEGSILTLFGVAMIVAYDHLDDKAKANPTLPEGVDEETVKEVAELASEGVESLKEAHEKRNKQ